MSSGACPRHTHQPKREQCPKCGKRGMGPWKSVLIEFERIPRRVRGCRYCNHNERTKWDSEQQRHVPN